MEKEKAPVPTGSAWMPVLVRRALPPWETERRLVST